MFLQISKERYVQISHVISIHISGTAMSLTIHPDSRYVIDPPYQAQWRNRIGIVDATPSV